MSGSAITEKILGGRAGEKVTARPDRIMAYDFPGFVDVLIHQLEDDFGVRELEDPDRYVIFIDHLVTNETAEEDDLHRVTREWAARTGINLIDNEGIGHHVAAELGFAVPGTFVVHFDAHVSGLGAFGTLGIGLHRQLLEPWVTGAIELAVPETIRVDLNGDLAPHVDARDLLHHLIRTYGADGFLGRVVEFGGPGAAALELGDRQAVCGMIMFTGAVSALFEPDERALEYVASVARTPYDVVASDPDAHYAERIAVDLSAIEPLVVKPGSTNAEHTLPVVAAVGTKVTRGYIGSCSSGRIEDLRAAAAVLRGKQVSPGFDLTAAGARIAGSSCDMCFGYARPLQDGEMCISTGTLNVRGRMGSARAGIYMGSAETVAASALAGEIVDPRTLA